MPSEDIPLSMKKRAIKSLDGSDIHQQFYAEVNVNPETLECSQEYYAAGVKLVKKEITTELAKKYAAHSLIAKDLKYLIKMMKYAYSVALDDNHDDESTSIFARDEIDYKSDILKAIYISSVVTYGKCFSQAHGRKVKLDRGAIFKDADRSIKDTHDDLMAQRNDYVAHWGNTKYESAKTFLLLHPSIEENLPPLITTSAMHVYGFSKSEYKRFLVLFEYVQETHRNTIRKLYSALQKHEVEGKSLNEFYESTKA